MKNNKNPDVLKKLNAIWASAEKASASPFLTDRAKLARIRMLRKDFVKLLTGEK